MTAVRTYHRPGTVEEAVELLAADPTLRPLAGGTDLMVDAQSRAGVVDLIDVAGLREVQINADTVTFGAAVTMAQLLATDGLARVAPGLRDAAKLLGGRQIRAAATVGGNVANASPAAETGPPLLVHQGTAEVAGPNGRRTVEVAALFAGPGRIALAPGELLVSFTVAAAPSAYQRVELRRSVDIALVSAAASVRVVDGRLRDAAVALGAAAPTPVLVPAAAQELDNVGLDELEAAVSGAGAAAASESAPIDDHRASGAYRRAMVEVVVGRAVRSAVARATSISEE